MRTALLAGGVAALCLLSAPCMQAQTIGVPALNDLYVDLGAVGAPVGPPGGAPCGVVPPFPIPPLTPFTINLSTPFPGLSAMMMVDVFAPCAPAVFCLPPVAGPYGAIPPVFGPFCPPIGPIGIPTNQTVDMVPTPTLTTLTTGVTLPGPAGPGVLISPVFINPAPFPLGVLVTLQGVFFDPISGSPLFGMVVSNAIEIII